MKRTNAFVVNLVLTILLLNLVICFSDAQPLPIGDVGYKQKECFDSNPTTGSYANIGTPTGVITNAFDGDLVTNINFYYGAVAYPTIGSVEVTAFKKPSDNGLADFGITFVDIKVDYRAQATSTSDERYRIVAYVDPSPTAIVLQDWVWMKDPLNHDAMYPPGINSAAAVRTFSNVAEPNNGAWNWTDMANLRVRIETQRGPSNVNHSQRVYLNEVWATAYTTPYPAPLVVTVMPPVVTESTGGIFYVDIYICGVTKMWGFAFVLEYDPAVLSPIEYMGYGPFVGALPSEIGADYVAIAYKTYDGDPVGFTGGTPLARIYFAQVGPPGSISLLPFDTGVTPPTLANIYGEQITVTWQGGWFSSREGDFLPPYIDSIARDPLVPNYEEDVTITARATDNIEVDVLILSYKLGLQWQDIIMTQYGNNFNATIPAQPYDTTVEYRIYANDTSGNGSTSPLYSYIIIDDIAPQISTSRSPEQPRANQLLRVFAYVSEPAAASGVEPPVLFFYRVNGQQWWTTNMTYSEQPDLCEVSIPGQPANSLVEYYVIARDNAGNENTTETHSCTVALQGDANLDHIVNVLDAAAVSAHWYPGPPIGPQGYDSAYDLNFDGRINVVDTAIISADWHKTW